MTEQLQKALAEFLSTLTSSLTDLSGQAPDLVKELVSYNLLKAGVYTILSLLFAFSFARLAHWFYKAEKKEKDRFVKEGKDYDEASGPTIGFYFIAGIFLILAASNITDMIQLYWFPKVWILGYIKGL